MHPTLISFGEHACCLWPNWGTDRSECMLFVTGVLLIVSLLFALCVFKLQVDERSNWRLAMEYCVRGD